MTGRTATIGGGRAGVAKLVIRDALKRHWPFGPCGFESHLRHVNHPAIPPDRIRPLPGQDYAYVLGMYLGDGCISRTGRTERLRITLDAKYPQIVARCRKAVAAVMPDRKASLVFRPDSVIIVSSYSLLWPLLLPQHGRGRKHERPIVLAEWQEEIVQRHPHAFIQGLYESDGTYVMNRVRSKTGVVYVYDRYMFSNVSRDIRRLFEWGCGLIGVETRPSNWNTISVARRASVATLNEFLGPKR
jgi:hypothetical protein